MIRQCVGRIGFDGRSDPVTPRSSTSLWIRLAIELVAALAIVFALTRFAAPMLMNIRSDLAFWAGVACWPLAAMVAAMAGVRILGHARALRRLKGGPVRLSGPD